MLDLAGLREIVGEQHVLTGADAAPYLTEHGLGSADPGRPADEGDHTEGTRERAAVLDLDERAHAVEPVLGVDAADRAHVARDKRARGMVVAQLRAGGRHRVL